LTDTTPFVLSWSHYLILMRIKNEDERSFYEIEAVKNHWNVRTLQRQYSSSLYERLLLSSDKEKVMELSTRGQVIEEPSDIIKDPLVLEFLGLEEKAEYSETDLETRILDHLQEFIMELGKGFTFAYRQKRFTFDENPTVGILLCQDKNDALVELTLPEGANIYAAKYELYLPDKKLLQEKLRQWLEEEDV